MLSCTSDDSSDDQQKITGKWLLKSAVVVPDLVAGPPTSTEVDITFEQNSGELVFNGKSSCNYYGGEVKAFTSNAIDLSELFSTEMLCLEDEINEFELIYFNWLNRANRYDLNGDTLTLFLDDDFELVFEKE